ncbi:MAG: MFS transporter [Myxococcota bacterium]|nr:MFS transporter [Myxococcota bacterium]
MKRRAPELLVALWGGITFGALLASYMAFRPVRDALVLEDYDNLPWLFTATLIAVTVLSPLWSALLARARPRRCVPGAFHAFAACVLGFAILIGNDLAPLAVGRVFYVWSAVFNLFVISVFWSLLADLLGPIIAKRLYGPIAAGGTIGAIAGPALTRLLVDSIGIDGVLVMSAVLLEIAVLALGQLRRFGERLEREDADVPPDAPTPGGPFRGFAQVARSPYLLAIVAYVLCTAIAATVMYMEQARITRAVLPDKVQATELFATIDLWTQVGTFVVQTFVASPLLALLGPGLVMLALPLAQAIGISSLAATPTLTTLVTVQVATRTITHGLTRPARELLFTVVSRDDKYRAKHAIDTVGYRLGDFGTAWLYQGLKAVGAGSTVLVATMLPIAGVWMGLALFLGVGYRRRAPLAQPPVAKELP